MSGVFWFRVGSILGFLGVTLGAFGAHGLRETLSAKGTTSAYQTGVQYHLVHALALLAVGLLAHPGRAATVAGWSFLVGVALFSGSLYALALTGHTRLGMITPLGGLAFLAGWAALAVAAGGDARP